MAERNWSVNIDLVPHYIRLEHGYNFGKRRIWVDGELVHDSRILFDHGSRHWIDVGGVEYEVAILTNGYRYRYFLFQDHEPIPSQEELKRGRKTDDLLRSPFLSDRLFMQAVGKALGLPYRPRREANWSVSHRLIGFRSGYLVMVTAKSFPETRVPSWLITVRHGEPLMQDTHRDLLHDARIQKLLSKMDPEQALQSDSTGTTILMSKKQRGTPEALAARIAEFLSIVAAYAVPLPQDRCENPECKQPVSPGLQLAIVNGYPVLLCSACIAEIHGHGEQARQLYHQSPVNLLPGLIVGVGIALLGAVAWAAFTLLLRGLVVIVPLLVCFWMLRAMSKVGTRVAIGSLLMITGLTFASTILGNYLANFANNLRIGYPLSVETVMEAYRDLVANREMLRISFWIALIGVGTVIFPVWSQNREALKSAFMPDVEVLPEDFEIP